MAKGKEVAGMIKLQIPAGKATPAPPVGPALGQHGINIMQFCQAFNNQTKDKEGLIIPVVITVYADKTITFITKSPPAAILLKQAAGIAKASGEPNKSKIAKVSKDKVRDIAKIKMKDLNTSNIESAMKIIAGTARSMGIEIET